ncbi:MAG: pyridoxal phosphate-dependent aminotransferase [Alphaproteobacteria bacterium]|nr:pyridoxal phosphate-dependent aminotransferase [Alphaproteobacteria bacterium]
MNIKNNFSFLGSLSPSATLSISAKAKEMKAQGVDVYSMTAGEPDFDTPQVIKDACIHAIETGKVRYLASSGLPELKTEIVKKFAANGIKTQSENIIISTGAKFAIFQAITCLCGVGDEVVLLAPYWLSYAEMIKASGAKLIAVETKSENGYTPKREDIEKVITDKTKLIIINSPNNPTGAVYTKETLQMIADIAIKHNIMVLSDEIYEKLIYDSDVNHISIASLNPQIAELTITINGFSKAYAMTGWRLGYLSAPQWLTQRIAALQSHATSNATSFVQYAAVCALQGKADSDVDRMIAEFRARRDLLCDLLQDIPQVSFYKPQGAFYVICDISSFKYNADSFAQKLLEQQKLAVIPCTAFGQPNCIRLSYACSKENIIESIKRLKNFINSNSIISIDNK